MRKKNGCRVQNAKVTACAAGHYRAEDMELLYSWIFRRFLKMSVLAP